MILNEPGHYWHYRDRKEVEIPAQPPAYEQKPREKMVETKYQTVLASTAQIYPTLNHVTFADPRCIGNEFGGGHYPTPAELYSAGKYSDIVYKLDPQKGELKEVRRGYRGEVRAEYVRKA